MVCPFSRESRRTWGIFALTEAPRRVSAAVKTGLQESGEGWLGGPARLYRPGLSIVRRSADLMKQTGNSGGTGGGTAWRRMIHLKNSQVRLLLEFPKMRDFELL